MIPFLAKLANLLDARGQHAMAREVDDLIEKIAQVYSPEQLINRYQEAEQANQRAAAKWRDAQQAWQARPTSDELLAARDEAKKQYDATWTARDQAKKEMDEDSGKTLTRLQKSPQEQPQQDVASKVPAKHKKAPSHTREMVAQIQKNLGLEPTGHWDTATNNKFIEAMTAAGPEYAKRIKGGKFDGTLQEAVQLTSNLSAMNDMGSAPQPQQDVASKVPATQPQAPAYKSKYDLMDIQDMAGKLIASGWKTTDVQNLVGIAENSADKTPGRPEQKQDAFERVFNNRARQYV